MVCRIAALTDLASQSGCRRRVCPWVSETSSRSDEVIAGGRKPESHMQIQLLSRQTADRQETWPTTIAASAHRSDRFSLRSPPRLLDVSRYRGCFTASRERSGRQAYPIGDRAGPTGGPQLRSRSRAGLSSPLCWHARTPVPPHRTWCGSARATPQMEGQHKTPSRHRRYPRPPNFRRAAYPTTWAAASWTALRIRFRYFRTDAARRSAKDDRGRCSAF